MSGSVIDQSWFGAVAPTPLPLILIAVALSLVPVALICTTSFLKLSIVFGILRNALGAQQIPSSALISALCLVLTIHIMRPVISEMVKSSSEPNSREIASETTTKPPREQPKEANRFTTTELIALGKRILPPIETFLRKHSRLKERIFFAQGQHSAPNDGPSTQNEIVGENFLTLLPAFILSEMQGAFLIGLFVFLPFLVIDLVVATILVAMGMNMVSPMTISLPLKIAVFVASDAWFLLCRSLVLHYK